MSQTSKTVLLSVIVMIVLIIIGLFAYSWIGANAKYKRPQYNNSDPSVVPNSPEQTIK